MVTFPEGTTPLQELHSHLNGYCGEHEDLNACLRRVRELVEELMPLEAKQEPPKMPSDQHFTYAAHVLAPVFRENGWKWAMPSGELRVPTAAEITKTLCMLAGMVHENGERAGTGRLVAFEHRWTDADADVRLGLEIMPPSAASD